MLQPNDTLILEELVGDRFEEEEGEEERGDEQEVRILPQVVWLLKTIEGRKTSKCSLNRWLSQNVHNWAAILRLF